MPNYAFEGPRWASSTITWSFAPAGGDFTNAIAGAYQSIVRVAVNRWAQVANITFKEVSDSTSVNIRIGWAKFAGTQIGETNFSYVTQNGTQTFRSGVTVRLEDPAARFIGTAFNSTYKGTDTTLYETVLHEMGHALGLNHSSDPTSVMFYQIGASDNDLNASDIQGIQILYGAVPAAAALKIGSTTPTSSAATPPSAIMPATSASNVVSVYRFFDSSNGTQFLTANLSERNAVIATRPDLAYEGLGLGALSSAKDDSNAVPVYRFFDTKNGSHFFTTSASENAQILATRSDLVSEQPSFFEHATQAAGDIPVYRFFDSNTGTHFFTNSSSEKTQLQATRPDLKLEGIAFYAPAVSAGSGLAQAAPSAAPEVYSKVISINGDTNLVYRFDSPDGRQLLTADPAERDAVLSAQDTFNYAGPVMGSIYPDGDDADVVPVFRFFNAANGDYLLTAHAAEVAQIAATRPDMIQEQTVFYEHLEPEDGDVPVYRFFNTTAGTHLYTADATEHASILATRPEMAQEGIMFYTPSIF